MCHYGGRWMYITYTIPCGGDLMSKCIKLLAAIVLLFTIAGCAATDGTMTSSRYGPYDGSYDFGAGDRYSPYPPYHHPSR